LWNIVYCLYIFRYAVITSRFKIENCCSFSENLIRKSVQSGLFGSSVNLEFLRGPHDKCSCKLLPGKKFYVQVEFIFTRSKSNLQI
jgi:hypothetical protein